MLLSSGMFAVSKVQSLNTQVSYSTQDTLDEGVTKIKDIYKTFEQVGIKDRSMIWNSSVASSFSASF